MGRFGCMMGPFGQCNGPFWTSFLEIKILGAVLAMGRFGIDPPRLYGICSASACPSRSRLRRSELDHDLPKTIPGSLKTNPCVKVGPDQPSCLADYKECMV